jgi:hypothetical protein
MLGGRSQTTDNRDGDQVDGEKSQEIQCGAARRNTIGAGGWNYAYIGVPNGGLGKCRSQGVQDCRLISKYDINLCLFMELNFNWTKVNSSPNLALWFHKEEREM